MNCYRDNIGLSPKYLSVMQAAIPAITESVPSVRKLVALMGMDKAMSYEAFGRNLDEIKYFDPKKVGTIEKGVIVKVNNSGVDEYFMTRIPTDTAKFHPQVWSMRADGKGLVPNKHWVRIDKNVTVENLVPKRFVPEEIDGVIMYRPARAGESGVFLNIQRPTDELLDEATIQAQGIDAIRMKVGAEEYYKPVHHSQVVDPDLYDGRDWKIRNIDETDDKENAIMERLNSKTRKVYESLPSQGAIPGDSLKQLAEGFGINETDLLFMTNVGKNVFGLDNKKAIASAVLMDRMVINMARRAGVTKAEIMTRLDFRKTGVENLPEGVKMQIDAWHGSAYFFDKFMLSKVNTGEGAQAYGWGLYFTSYKDIAEHYAKTVSRLRGDYIKTNAKLSSLEKEDLSFLSINFKNKFTDIESLKKVVEELEREAIEKWRPDGIGSTLIERAKRRVKLVEKLAEAKTEIGEPDKFLYKIKLWKEKTPNLLRWEDKIEIKDIVERLEAIRELTKKSTIFTKIKPKILSGILERLDNAIKNYKEILDPNYIQNTKNVIYKELQGAKAADDLYGFVDDEIIIRRGQLFDKKSIDMLIDNGYAWVRVLDESNNTFTVSESLKQHYGGYHTKIISVYVPSASILTNGYFYEDLSDNILKNAKETSMALKEIGFDGVEYLAEKGARGGFNYVVFDENAVSMEEVLKFQRDAIAARGAAMVEMDGRAIIYALTDPNVSTPMHEMAHVFEHYLTDAERNVFLRYSGASSWDTNTSEVFARGFEKYLAEGVAPSRELATLFDSFKQWLKDIYRSVVGSEIDITLNNDMRRVYDTMLQADPSMDPVKAAKNNATQTLSKQGWFQGHGVMGPGIGYVVGDLIDKAANDEDEQMGLEWLGLLAGSRRSRAMMKPAFDKVTVGRFKNVPAEHSTMLETDSIRRKFVETSNILKADPDNPAEMTEKLGMWQSVKQTIREGGNPIESIFRNRYFQSADTFVRSLGESKTITRLRDALGTMGSTVSQYRALASTNFAASVGGGTGSYRTYKQTDMPSLVGRILGEGSPEDHAEIGNNILLRVLMSGAEIGVDGRLTKYADMENVRIYFEDPELGKMRLDLAEKMLSDDTFRKFVDAHRKAFRSMGFDFTQQVNRRILRDIENSGFSADQQQALKNFTAFGQNKSLGAYIKELKSEMSGAADFNDVARIKNEIKVLEDLTSRNPRRMGQMDDKVVRRILSNHESVARVALLDYQYLPQMLSRRKLDALRSRFYQERGLLAANVTPDSRKAEFEEFLMDKIMDVNLDSKAKKAISDFDPITGRFDRKVFKSKQEAEQAIRNVIDGATHLTAEQRNQVFNNLDSFILKQNKQTKNGPKEVFHVAAPEGLSFNPFMMDNKIRFKGFSDYIMDGMFVPRSNWLDNPRTRLLPFELLEDDLDQIMSRYAFDAGRKIHLGRFDMIDIDEVNMNYVSPIKNALLEKHAGNQIMTSRINQTMNRLEDIYHTAVQTHNMSASEMDNHIKNMKRSDTIRNLFFLRFGYGFSFYNMFEFLAVGPLISSFDKVTGSLKHFAANKKALENYQGILIEAGKTNKMIRGSNFELDDPRIVSEGVSSKLAAGTGYLSEKMAGFSFSKYAMKKFFKADVENLGVARLVFDSFDGSNLVATTVVGHAAIGEANTLARILRNMPEEGVLREGGQTYTRGDVTRQLRNLGIAEDQIDDFVREQTRLDDVIVALDNNKLNSVDVAVTHAKAYDYLVQIMSHTTDTFHGTNRFMRPETWMTPFGKTMSMYSTYPFNFAKQYVQERMFVPIRQFGEKYPGAGGNLLSILNAYRKNDMAYLRRNGWSQEAIEEFPIGAYAQVGKLFGSVGVSIGGLMSMAVMKDLITYPLNDYTEQEQWLSTRRFTVLNPDAPESDQYTWGDLDNDIGVTEFMDMFSWFGGMAARTGGAGRYGDLITNRWMIKRDGLMGVTPVTAELNKLTVDMIKVFDNEPDNWPLGVTGVLSKKAFDFTPILGSSMFSPVRKTLANGLAEQFQGIFGIDTETGQQYKASDFDFNDF